MSWMEKLYRTYDAIEENTHIPEGKRETLTPIGHTRQTAHIIITLDINGHFLRAEVCAKKFMITLPATEAAESRTSGVAAFPLDDKLQYVAQDLADYGIDNADYFNAYHEQLKAWSESPYSTVKIKAIYYYINQGRVMADLIRVGIFDLNENQQLIDKWEEDSPSPEIFSVLPKTKGVINPAAALVAWRVEEAGNKVSNTWEDKALQHAWVDYSPQQQGNTDVCYITGRKSAIANMHPAKLRHSGDKAKLISANDSSGFTYRGKFTEPNQTAEVSQEVTAKAHSTLRWLIAEQGIRNGDQVTVAWAISATPVEQPLSNVFTPAFVETEASEIEQTATDYAEKEVKNWAHDIGYRFAELLKRYRKGLRVAITDNEQISLITIDSATPGRMSVTYYQEFLPQTYFARLDKWQEDFSWYLRQTFPDNEQRKKKLPAMWMPVAPSANEIAETVYGKSLSDSLKKQLYVRLLPCITEAAPIPFDIVQKAFYQACHPTGFDNWEWQRNVGVACALIRGWYARNYHQNLRRSYSMALDLNNHHRDYLYGRLLAVAENLESYALYLAGETSRMTTAERYMQRFAQNPYQTWGNIELALMPYKTRIERNRPAVLYKYNQQFDEIMAAFDEQDFIKNDALSPEFLLAYHCQKFADKKTKKTDDTASLDEKID